MEFNSKMWIWTNAELMDLWDMYMDNLHWDDIASLMGRTRAACQGKIYSVLKNKHSKLGIFIQAKCLQRDRGEKDSCLIY